VKKMDNYETPISFVDGIVIERDYLKLIACPDSVDPWEEDFARLYYYDGQHEDPWSAYDLDWHVMGICLWTGNPTKRRTYVVLSTEGQVEFHEAGDDGGRYAEHIPDAGLHEAWSADYGYVYTIRQVGLSLYACGNRRQVYKRTLEGQWVHVDKGILLPKEDKSMRCLMDIAGLSESSMYAAGRNGEVFYFDGRDWLPVITSIDEDLFRIKIVSNEEVYVVGANGALLMGNHIDGFRDLSSIEDNQRFSSIEIFNGQIFLASNLGMFVYDRQTRKITPYQTGLVPDLADCHILEARDGVLWSIGFKDLAWFDGRSWTRLDHPENPPIR
jgi:hypothetical protein